MNSLTKKKTERGKVFGKLKRGLALLMAVIMAVTTPLPGLSFPSQAAPAFTPLETELVPTQGGGLTTAYMFKNNSDGLFDIEGISNPSLIGSASPYQGLNDHFGNLSVSTTYWYLGYEVRTRAGTNSTSSTVPSVPLQYTKISTGDTNKTKNGGVRKDIANRLQYRVKVYPSDDGSAVIVEYTVQNTSPDPQYVQISTRADIWLGGHYKDGGPNPPASEDPADSSKLFITNKGISMINAKSNQTYELITKDPELGLTTPPTSIWVGSRTDMLTNGNDFKNLPVGSSVQNQDSAMTYSWTINLPGYGRQTKKVAYRVNNASFYVNSSLGRDTNAGTAAAPFQTVERAIRAIKEDPSNKYKIGNIYFQTDYNVSSTIKVPDGMDITFASTNYNTSVNPVSKTYTVKRAPGFTSGPMFQTDGATLRLSHLTVDGGGAGSGAVTATAPLVSASSGLVNIQTGTTLQNAKMTKPGVGGAIDITGAAKLQMLGGVISNNKVSDKGAVHVAGTGDFTVQGNVWINNNTNGSGAKSNVYLEDGKYITVTKLMNSASEIGVSSAVKPAPSPGGVSTSADQEVVVVKAQPGTGQDAAPPPFAPYFFADEQNDANTGAYMVVGTAGIPGVVNSNRNLVLKKNSYQLSFKVTPMADAPAIPPADIPSIPPQRIEAGAPVTTAPAPAIPGYKLEHTEFSPATTSLKASTDKETAGALSGTMPGADTVVNYVYRVVKSSITFHLNGGTPDHPDTWEDKWEGKGGLDIGKPMPTVSKPGYIFKGWSLKDAGAGSPIVDPFPTQYPNDELDYYATFAVDPALTFNLNFLYTNEDESAVFWKEDAEKHNAEYPISHNSRTLKDYTFDAGTSRSDPPNIGKFYDNNLFTGPMPNQDTTLYYHYKAKPDKTYNFTVNYVSENGTKLSEPTTSAPHIEEAISATPIAAPSHYSYVGYRFDTGTEDQLISGGQVYGVRNKPAADGAWSDKMPNQDVTLTYLYKGDAATSFNITYKHMDVTDPKHPVEISSSTSKKAVDTPITASYTPPYGYKPSPSILPSVNVEGGAASSLAFGTGDHAYELSGAMPAANVTVTYNEVRDLTPPDPSKPSWSTISYKGLAHGALSKTADQTDLTTSDGGVTYQAPILISNGTPEGMLGAYTWQMLKDRKLLPAATPDAYYKFTGWYLDKNGNGTIDAGEPLLGKGDASDTAAQNKYYFSAPPKLLASFEKDTAQWMNINFSVENGKLTGSGALTQNIPRGITWEKYLTLFPGAVPQYTPWAHYTDAGWYTKAGTTYTKVTGSTVLAENQTYIHRFLPGPDLFAFKTDYSSASGVVFKTLDNGKKTIDAPVEASYQAVPGYMPDKTSSNTTPATYAFDGTTQKSFGSFNSATNNYSGTMPGTDLTVHYKYKVDPGRNYALTVEYVTKNGVTLHAPSTQNLPAEGDFTADSLPITGYTCSSFAFKTGQTPADMVVGVAGTPVKDGTNIYRYKSKMPNQRVTLVYTYEGNAADTHKITQNYVDDVFVTAANKMVKTVVSDPTPPDTRVNGAYAPQYGYTKIKPDITYNPANPAGADLAFAGDAWSGHMPAADVTIKYNLARNPARWVTVTYRAGLHGDLDATGKADLQSVVGGDPGVKFSVKVLKDDPTDLLNAPYTWAVIQAKNLSPNTSAENASLYHFEGWFVDTNGDRVRQDSEPLVTATQTFKVNTTLTASFKENADAWIDVKFAADKGSLGTIRPDIQHVPKGTTWGDIKTKGLPALTPWGGYKFDNWYDGTTPMNNDTAQLVNGHTYTAKFIADPTPAPEFQYDYTVQYESADGLIFKTEPVVKKHIEEPVTGTAITVPGYEFDKANSFTTPKAYNFDHADPYDPTAPAAQIGSFSDDGSYTGKMPGEALVVHYRYKVKPAPTPDKKPFTLTIQYHSAGGAELLPDRVEKMDADESFTRNSEMISHYTCTSFNQVTGWTADPSHGVQAMQSKPVGVGSPVTSFNWSGKMPNQNVTLTYIYTGDKDPGSKFTITEKYIDRTDPASPREISRNVSALTAVDEPVNGEYVKPYGYDAQLPFTITVDKGAATNLKFGTGADKNKWSGRMPAGNVTITYNNTRHVKPTPDDPAKPSWAAVTYQKAKIGEAEGHGTLASTSPDVTETTPGKVYTAQILVSDGTEQGNKAAYTWKQMKEKGLVPTATADKYYTFAGWFVDNDGSGTVTAGDTPLGLGTTADPTGDATYFNGKTTLIASFEETTGQWIDINFAAENGDLQSGKTTLHIQSDKTWNDIKTDRVPVYKAWPHYDDDGWYAGAKKVQDTDGLINGQTYTHKFVPSEKPENKFTYTIKHTNLDGSIVFETTVDPEQHKVTDPVKAGKIDIPGYVWKKDQSGTDPAEYQFNPSAPAVAIGNFLDSGAFIGRMPGQNLTVYYRYDVAPKPPKPEDYPFNLTIRYESRNGGTLSKTKSVQMNADDPIDETPVAVDHYDCDGFEFVKGDKVVGTAQPVEGKPDKASGYAWKTKMPNQDVELIYLYKGKTDPTSKFTITENYMDVTEPTAPKLISSTTSAKTAVDTVVNGAYVKPFGYDAKRPFTITVDSGASLNLKFGTGADADKWSGPMPAGNVTITYNNTRHVAPTPDDPAVPSWAAVTYQKAKNGEAEGHGTLASTSPDVTATTPGKVYTAQVLVSDGTDQGNKAAYTWKQMKEKGLVPTATADPYYTFAGWYVDKDGSGTVSDGDTPLGLGTAADTTGDTTYFTGKATLIASFVETTGQWIDINFAAENGDLLSGATTLHIQSDKTWNDIKTDRVPVYKAWPHYDDDGWYAGTKKVQDGDTLIKGQTYTHKFVPSVKPENQFTYTTKYTNLDGSIVFKTTVDPKQYKITEPVEAGKIDVPGYVWNKDKSGTDPADYKFNPGAPAVAIGSFTDSGAFTGKMPGQNLTVYYRYDVAPKPPTPDKYPFNLTIRYESRNGGTLSAAKSVQMNADDPIAETPVAVDHYDCDGFTFVKGDTAVGTAQPVKDKPNEASGYAWNTKMPNQDVELIYLYKGKTDPSSKFTITENYMDVTDPASPKLITTTVSEPKAVDEPVHGEYVKPYGYDKGDFKITLENPAALLNLKFGTGADADKWSGPMPASNVTITYNNTRHVKPTPDDPALPSWAAVTYQKAKVGEAEGHGTLASTSPDVTVTTPGKVYTAQVLISDGTEQGNKTAYTWKQMKEKGLVPTATADPYYTFAGWYVDKDGSGTVSDGDTPLGLGTTADPTGDATYFTDKATLIASFVETTGQWIDINFAAENADLQSGATTLHIQADKTWNDIKTDRVPVYKAWPHYDDDGWYAGASPVKDGDPLINGQTYTHKFVPSVKPENQFTYTIKYTNLDGSIVFKTTVDSKKYRITDRVEAEKIDVPGYVWNKDKSGTDPADYKFNPSDPAVSIGSFDAGGKFIGKMPGQDLTVYYRYDVAPRPPKPEDNPFNLTIRYESRNGGTLSAAKSVQLNADDPINETPVAVDHYDCDGFRFVKGDTAVGTAQPVAGKPDKASGYAWKTKMPNQDVELIYLYKGKTDPTSKFTITENYMDVTDPTAPKLISSTTSDKTAVDTPVNGAYVKPFGYDAKPPFTITVDSTASLNLKFGTGADADKWSGPMPAGNVTITYNNTRHVNPDDPTESNWAAVTYQKAKIGEAEGHGTLSSTSPDVTATTPGKVYTAQVLVSDGTEQGNKAAYTWKQMKEKGLVPTATADKYYTFEGWYVDKDGSGTVSDGDTPLGLGTAADTTGDTTYFTGKATLIASFKETTGQWIDINFAAENADLQSGETTLHIQSDKTWNDIKTDSVPVYKAWPHYDDDGWYAGAKKVQDGDTLIKGQTYTHKFVPSVKPENQFTYTIKYTNLDGSIVFKTTVDPKQYKITEPVEAGKIDVPGYVWKKDKSGTDPAEYKFNPGAPAVAIGSFADSGAFTGKMPGQNLTVYYRYDVAPKPPTPDKYPFNLTIRYESRNGGTLSAAKSVKMNADDPIAETPVAVDHYDCDGFTFVKGDKAVGTAQPVKDKPDEASGYAWNTKMPNQDVELIYLYKGKTDPTSKFTITENYMDVTNPASPRLITTAVSEPKAVDEPVQGEYVKPYGYDKGDFKITLENPAALLNLKFGTGDDADKWSGPMPASNVTVTYNNTRHVTPTPDDPKPSWAAVTYQKAKIGEAEGHGTLASTSPDVAETTPGKVYTAQVLISDGTEQGNKNAYTWKQMKEKHLVPTATADPYYTFAGWYIDNDGSGTVTDGDTPLGLGTTADPTGDATYFTGKATLIASFVETTGQWIDISFAAENADLQSGKETLHIQADKTWNDIKTDRVPVYKAWPHYDDDGWYAGASPVKDGDPLINGQTYTHKFIPSVKPENQFTYTTKYTNLDGSIVFKTTVDSKKYSITDRVEAEKIDVPGYIWNKDKSGTDPADYKFNPSDPAVSIGSFDADGNFIGKMPGQDLTVYYRYDVAPKPPKPEDYPFNLTIRYESRNGGTLSAAKSVQLNADDPIDEKPVAVDHYDCDGFTFVKGDTVVGTAQPVKDKPDKASGYAWKTKMPNQDVELIYLYKGKTDPTSKFTITENYMDVTEPTAPKLISSTTSDKTAVDTPVNGAYVKPFGYDAKPPFTITVDSGASLSLKFGTGADADKWSGPMPAGNVTITYNNTRHVAPTPDDPSLPNWATMTYQKTDNGTLSASEPDVSADVTTSDGGTTYTTQILVSDGTAAGDAGAYTWKILKEKKLIPKAAADTNYEFVGWYIDNDGSGTVSEGDTLLGKGDDTDGEKANDTFFKGPVKLVASFVENPDNWIDIKFAAEKGSLGTISPDVSHIPQGTTWGTIKTKGLPELTPWDNYKFDNWYDGTTVMKDTDVLAAGKTYTARFIPDPNPALQHKYTVEYTNDYTNEADKIVFKTTAPADKSIEDSITPTAITVPGYEFDKASSYTTPKAYNFTHADPYDPTAPEAQVGSFADDGAFTGKMPGEDLTVHYRYKVVPKPPKPEDYPFTLTVKYHSASGAQLLPDTVTRMNAEDEINLPSPAIDHYTCGSFTKDAGWTADADKGTQAVKDDPAGAGTPPAGFTWNTRMPNQDVTLTYIYTGDTDPSAKFTITEKYVDVTNPAEPRDVSSTPVFKDTLVDQAVAGQYAEPYGYKLSTDSPFSVTLETSGIKPTIFFGTGDTADKWSGFMPASNVTITYRVTRDKNPDVNAWAKITYQKDGKGSLSTTSPDVTTTDGGKTYSAQVLVSDGTDEGNKNAYTWKMMKEKNLVPAATPESKYYKFTGWYLDDGDGTLDISKDKFLGTGAADDPGNDQFFTGPARLFASFTEDADQWINISFMPDKGSLDPSNTKPETLHVQSDKTWGDIQGELPNYKAWAHYEEDGWYQKGADGAADTPMQLTTALVKDATYIHRFKPSTDVKDQFDFITDYSSSTDPGLVFKTTDPVKKSIEDPVGASKIDVPGYTWVKADSSAEPASYTDPSGTLISTGSFDDAGVFIGHMPGENLTVHYKYQIDPVTHPYTLTVKYLSNNNVSLFDEPAKQLAPEAPIHTAPVTIAGYTCYKTEFEKGKTPGDMIAAAPGEPDSTTHIWDSVMPNQDVTIVYRYEADKHLTYALTEKYMDTSSADTGLQEISSSVMTPEPHADDHVEGSYKAPAGYEPDPAKPFTVEPAGTSISFDPEHPGQWSGFMPAKAVTITYYNKRIPYDPEKPETHFWGDLTYKPGQHGALTNAGDAAQAVSPDVKPAGSTDYTASILLDNAETHRPEAYTWRMIQDKDLLPRPVADENYQFEGWFIDTNGDGVRNTDAAHNEPLLADDSQTFTAPADLTASFVEEPGKWVTVDFAAENGTLNSDHPHSLHVTADKTWGDIRSELPTSTPWPGYKTDGWYDKTETPAVPMDDSMLLKDGKTYTLKSIPDPDAAHQYTVKYTNEDGSIIFKTITDDTKRPVMYPATAALESVEGYEWDPDASGTVPAAYQFNPSEAPKPIGHFGSDGAFTGDMPGKDLTVIYKYKKKADAQYPLTVRYETATGVSIHAPILNQMLHPGDELNTAPEKVEGYNIADFRIEKGRDTVGEGGSLLNPVTGEPDRANGFKWSSTMPNQPVTLVYIYKGDESAHNTLTERWVDKDAAAGSKDIIPAAVNTYKVGSDVSGTFKALYGYEKSGDPVITLSKPWDGDMTITFDSDGNWSGAMLPRDVVITYGYKKIADNPDHPDKPDADHPWGDLTYLPGKNGSLIRDDKVSADVKDYTDHSGGTEVHGYQARILLDNSAAGELNKPYTFGEVKTRGLIPTDKADSYYQFEGWFVDKNKNGIRDISTDPSINEPLLTDDSQTFSIDSTTAERTLTASFIKNPKQWYRLTFTGEHAVLSGGTNPLDIPYDKHWSDVVPSLPSHTAEINYKDDGWYDTTDAANYIKMTDGTGGTADMPISDGHTYTYVCYQNPEIFGTNVETPDASGTLDGQGKGRITIYDTKEGAYQYILTDLSGTILRVVPRRSVSQRVEFDGLSLGTKYHVYEAAMNLAVQPGGAVPAPDHTTISDPAEVSTPVLADNYQVYYNDENSDEAKARLVIMPADPDSDYAVLDKNGQVVQAPGASADGFINSSGGSTVEFPGLNYGEEYTIVARPKGQTDITAESRKEDGTVITADPVGDLVLNKYIIETTLGTILNAGGVDVGGSIYKEAHKKDQVNLTAPAVNDAGEAFVRWETTIGDLDTKQGGLNAGLDLAEPNLTFAMPAGNLVMTPVYNHNPAPDAAAEGEVRGGNKKEFALDPNEIPGMERELTQDKDRELVTENGADVTYKLVYKKSAVKSNEPGLVQDSGEYPNEHKDAFHAAWGLNVSMERYVNGRKVDPASSSDAAPPASLSDAASPASPSDAAGPGPAEAEAAARATASDAVEEVHFDDATAYRTYIQMGSGDVDMMDYQLYEITTDEDGTQHAVLVPVSPAGAGAIDPDSRDADEASSDPDTIEQDGGLFTFYAKPGSRYVMVYSRAYHLYFTNELLDLQPQYYNFKVRQNEAPKASYYAAEYGDRPVPEPYVLNEKTGAEYNYKDWSYNQNSLKSFDPSRGIKNTTHVYAFYTNNEQAVEAERKNLQQTIDDAWKLSQDPFMKSQDSKNLKADIEEVRGVLQQENPRAKEKELQDARKKLLDKIKYYQGLLKGTHDEYEEIQSGSSGGGSGGGGGGGHGIKSDPYNATPTKNYTVGTNGNWKAVSDVPGQGKEWAFVLNGGYKLKSIWAYLKYPEVTNTATGWYHFNSSALMDSGWFKDEKGKWYYSYKLNEGPEGRMATGWHLEASDGNWYYLDPSNGDMAIGWKQIDGKWYYFETVGSGAYVQDPQTGDWVFGGKAGHPLGSMYKSGQTPDGYMVDANGAWIQ